MSINNEITLISQSISDDLIRFIRDIIAIPSPSGKEEEVIKRIKQEMEIIGYDKIHIDKMGNLIGIIGSGPKTVAFDGHCDTVRVGDLNNWHCNPFQGEFKNGIIYGRGAADQKSGLASAIYAGKIIKELSLGSNITFVVVASVLEEGHEGLCWKHIIEQEKVIPKVVVLTEPSDMSIKIGQRGRMAIKLQTHGISCHGAVPERGENAIYNMAPIIMDIEKLNQTLRSNSILGKGTITITDISSTAPSLNAIADSASIYMDRRLTEGENLESTIGEIENLDSVKEKKTNIFVPENSVQSYTGYSTSTKAFHPVWLMERSNTFVKMAQSAYFKQFSNNTDLGVWQFSTNGVATKGVFNIPTIGFGPGKEEHAHSPEDQVIAKDCIKATSFYAAFAYLFDQQ